jgi:hypothetical protein
VFESGIVYHRAGDPQSVKVVTYQAQEAKAEQDQGSSSVWDWFKQLIGWE